MNTKKDLLPPDPNRAEKLAAFDRLLTIMDELRTFCPWDKKQTMESLRYLTIEEVYELSESILNQDFQEVKKELGDMMLHILFYSKIGSEQGDFDIEQVLDGISDKLIHRHPHVYADVKADNETQVSENWEKIKLKEKGNKSVLGGVPGALPSLVKAMRIQEKARGVGFDWDKKEQVWEKVEEEMQEFKAEFDVDASDEIDRNKAEAEFGDLLFSLINYARFVDINPEDALERTNRKFIKRFNFLEQGAKDKGLSLANMTLEEMDIFWEAAKSED
jgi:tetrapyrrole methylase family protein/MazG family protein